MTVPKPRAKVTGLLLRVEYHREKVAGRNGSHNRLLDHGTQAHELCKAIEEVIAEKTITNRNESWTVT